MAVNQTGETLVLVALEPVHFSYNNDVLAALTAFVPEDTIQTEPLPRSKEVFYHDGFPLSKVGELAVLIVGNGKAKMRVEP